MEAIYECTLPAIHSQQLGVQVESDSTLNGGGGGVDWQEGGVDNETLVAIQAYCCRSWQNGGIAKQDWDDCTQEVFERLLGSLRADQVKTAITERDSEERRELHRAIWAAAQRRRRAKQHATFFDDDTWQTPSDPWPEKNERLAQVHSAIDAPAANLPPRQKEIVTRWSKGDAREAIAADLGLSPERVSDEKYKALQKLRQHFGTTS